MKVEVVRDQPVQPAIKEVVIRMTEGEAMVLRERMSREQCSPKWSNVATDLDKALEAQGIKASFV